MFDLTGLLTTIASSSATLAAIIGGFIASRLIALNTERAEILVRIQEIDEEIALQEKKINEMRQSLVEDDAIDFIAEHVDNLIDGRSLDEVCSEMERLPESITREELNAYWDRARGVTRKLLEFVAENGYSLDSDGLPSGFAVNLPDFDYQIAELVWDAVKKRLKSASPKTTLGGLLDVASWDFEYRMPRVKSIWYQKTKNDMHIGLGQFELRQLQKKQLETRQKALKQPRGVIDGLVVFLIVVLLGVLAPLAAVPFVVDDYQTMLRAKCLYLGLFLLVLGIAFGYFLDLARWKTDETDTLSKICAVLFGWLNAVFRNTTLQLGLVKRSWSKCAGQSRSDTSSPEI